MASSLQPAPTLEKPAELCPSCGIELQGRFCHQCGEKQFKKHDLAFGHFATHVLHEFTHLDAKIFRTLRYLFLRPGFLTTEYVAGRKSRYMKPLSLFLMAVTALFLADSIHPLSFYNIEWDMQQDRTGAMNAMWEKLAAKNHQTKELIIERAQERIHRVVTVVQFANVLAMALVLWMLYRNRYFAEHLVAALHFLAFLYLGAVLFWPLNIMIGIQSKKIFLLAILKFAVYLTYLYVTLRRVYLQKAGITMVKAVVIYGWVQLVLILAPILTLDWVMLAAAKS